VYGEPLDMRLGSLYAAAVEVICLYLGTSFQPGFTRPPVTELDELLKGRNCPVEVSGLAYRGSPIPIPSDDVGVGYWDPGQVLDAHPFFHGPSLPQADQLTQEFVAWINTCLEEAAGHGDDGLVGFVY
jgi:hypothetical protein